MIEEESASHKLKEAIKRNEEKGREGKGGKKGKGQDLIGLDWMLRHKIEKDMPRIITNSTLLCAIV